MKYPGIIVHAIAVTNGVMSTTNENRMRNAARMMERIEGLSLVFYWMGLRTAT